MKIFWLVFIVDLVPFVLTKSNKPHIITIFLDDLGWHDLGYHGTDQIKTPNIDSLAYSGMILSRHYALPSCTPSRSALLTGSYPIRTGMQGFPLKGGENRNLPLTFKLTPSHLKDLGYKTHMVGKWHLGYQTYNHVPNNRGFDTFFGYYNGFIDYFTYYYNQSVGGFRSNKTFEGYDMHLNDDVYWTKNPIYATKAFTQRAQDVIRHHNTSHPMYLYFSHVATHTGTDDYMGMQIPTESDVNSTYPHIKHYGRRVFAGCLEELDKSVGIVVEELKNKGMLENSIILLMSDNGGHTVSVDMAPNWSSNWPLAGTKFTMYEGGVRVAALLWSPLLPKGYVNDGFIHISDWLPTLYSAAGGNPENLGQIDGRDQWEALKNLKTVKRDNLLINIDEKINAEGDCNIIVELHGIIINERWKVVKGGFQGYALYDFHWGEEENVAPNPPYNLEEVKNSQGGRSIQTLSDYQNIFDSKRMIRLREMARVNCIPPRNEITVKDGYVNVSSEHRCSDYCVFDIKNDPCELKPIKNDNILKIGKILLQEYKKKLVPQKTSVVDPKSDPSQFGNVWMPWDVENCAKSLAKDFSSQYLNVSILLTLSWYSLFQKKKSK